MNAVHNERKSCGGDDLANSRQDNSILLATRQCFTFTNTVGGADTTRREKINILSRYGYEYAKSYTILYNTECLSSGRFPM